MSSNDERGGNVTIRPGRGYGQAPSGDVVFFLPGQENEDVEVLRIRHDGAFLVRGVVVETDLLVYAAFREWLSRAIVRNGADKE